jgi:hypothetical protein
MAILAAIMEGSDEARQKRAVRRYLNKKKDKRDRQDESVVQHGNELDESVVEGSVGHMMHEIHRFHKYGSPSEAFHIHKLAEVPPLTSLGTHDHHYIAIHKQAHHHPEGGYTHPASKFRVWEDGGKTHVVHTGPVPHV